MAEVRSHFDRYTHDDAYHKDPDFYFPLIEYLREQFKLDRKIKILDVGCGDGSFIKDMIRSGIGADLMGMDLSSRMISMAKDNVKNYPLVELMNADAFHMPLKSNFKFDVIHIDSVLHHIIGKTRSNSIRLTERMLRQLTDRLTENGILIVEEWTYVSYLVPQFTSTIIFYGLKLLNFLQVDISKIIKEIKLGLEVNFLHEKEVKNLLKRNSMAIFMEKKMPRKQGIPWLYRCFLLKNIEYASFVARPQSINQYKLGVQD